MTCSGLQELIEAVFAGNAVGHMLTGKTNPRAVCGHMSIDAALITIRVAHATIITIQFNSIYFVSSAH